MNTPRFWAVATIAVGLLAPRVQAQATDTAPRWQKDLVYSRASGEELKLDIVSPAQGSGPFPVVLYFHGGGWQAGRRQDSHGQLRFLASQGFVAITVSYRFVPQHPWPAQVHDAKTAVRYVRAHAQELNIDPARVAAAGDSAGAALALMLGLTGPEDGLEGEGEWRGMSSRVQAVVSFYSAADFTRGGTLTETPRTPEQAKRRAELETVFQPYYKKTAMQVIADMGGTTDPQSPRWKQLSPLTYVSTGDAPTLIIQGDADPIVVPEQARWLADALAAAGVPHELLMIPGGGHGFTREQHAVAGARMIAFLQRYLPAQSSK